MGTRNKRGDVVATAYRLLRLLDGRRYMPPIAGLAKALGVCDRTVHRYLAAAEKEGIKLPRRCGWNGIT